MCDAQNVCPKGAADATAVISSMEPVTRSIFKEVEKLISLVLCLPISAALAERSFSSLRRMKTWMRSTFSQQCFTQLAILAIHKNRLQNVGMKRLMQTSISKTAERRAIFGKSNYATHSF
jgi:hypothetical protein